MKSISIVTSYTNPFFSKIEKIRDDLTVGNQPTLPSILGPRPSLLGPRPSILGPRPSLLGPHLSCRRLDRYPLPQKFYRRPCVSINNNTLHMTSSPLIKGVKRARVEGVFVFFISNPVVKKQRNLNFKHNVQKEKTNHLDSINGVKDCIRKRKYVWEHDRLIMENPESTPKKTKDDEDLNQLTSQQQHFNNFNKFGNPYTPQANEFINLVDDFACALCSSNCLNKLLVVAFVLSKISTKTFVLSRSIIDNLKKCWISLDTDHEIYTLVCSCHLRLFIRFLPLFLEYHSNFSKQLNNAYAQAEAPHELTFLVSTLRNIWSRRNLQAYDNVNFICFNRLFLLYVMRNVYFSNPPSLEAFVAIIASIVL